MERKFNEYKDKENYGATVLIVSSKLASTKNGSTFGNFKFKNLRKEEIEAKKWQLNTLDEYPEGAVIDVVGKIQVYNGKKSLIIEDVRMNNELSPDDFKLKSPLTEEKAKEIFNKFVESIKSENVQFVVNSIIDKLSDRYYTSPAAEKIHHEFKGGLAYHSLTMAKIANNLAPIYPHLNRDLLVAAALIHDSGKTIELFQDGTSGYSLAGRFYGHIIILNDILQEVIFEHPELKEDNDIAHLKHILLAHHGKLEWGSPVQGATPEAILFHHIDKIDADMQIASKEMDALEGNETSQRVWALESRYIINVGDKKILEY